MPVCNNYLIGAPVKEYQARRIAG